MIQEIVTFADLNDRLTLWLDHDVRYLEKNSKPDLIRQLRTEKHNKMDGHDMPGLRGITIYNSKCLGLFDRSHSEVMHSRNIPNCWISVFGSRFVVHLMRKLIAPNMYLVNFFFVSIT